MSAISQKSISGITSITSPAGTDDQISLHTSNTNEALKIDGAGNLHFNNHVNTTGVSTASNFKTGSSNLHSTGLNVGNTFVHSTGINGSSADIDDFISVGSNIHLGNAGVITATSYRGDGSQLTGIVAGLSTISGVVNVANDLNVDGHTNLDNVSIAGVTTFTEDIYLRDDKYIYLGNDTPGNDAKIYFDEYNLLIQNSNSSGQTYIRGTTTRLDAGDTSSGFQLGVRCRKVNSSLITEIYGGSTRRILTTNSGVVVTGIMTATSFSGDGSNLTGVSGPEVYGFTGIGSDLQVRTTNGGADDITSAQYDAFEQVLFAPSGITFSINNNGKLIATF